MSIFLLQPKVKHNLADQIVKGRVIKKATILSKVADIFLQTPCKLITNSFGPLCFSVLLLLSSKGLSMQINILKHRFLLASTNIRLTVQTFTTLAQKDL